MEQFYLIAAAALSALWFLVHVFLGGREVARPLRTATGMTDEARLVAWMCWHFTSVALAVMALGYGGAALWNLPGMAISATAMALGFALTGTWITARSDVAFIKAPQGLLFIPQVILGTLALL